MLTFLTEVLLVSLVVLAIMMTAALPMMLVVSLFVSAVLDWRKGRL
jgi:hypothetical protein